MRKLFLSAGVFIILVVVSLTFSSGTYSANAEVSAEVELIKRLSSCVDQNRVVVDNGCLRTTFFPRLGLGPKGRVERGQIGFNSDSRFFSFLVRETSLSGGTTGLFEVTFYLERHVGLEGGTHRSTFEARSGHLYGTIPHDHTGLLSLYDLANGDHLVSDNHGKTVGSMDLELDKRWSADHTAARLVNSGKWIGFILRERLETVERSGKGGHAYLESAEDRHRTFDNMDSKHRLQFLFK